MLSVGFDTSYVLVGDDGALHDQFADCSGGDRYDLINFFNRFVRDLDHLPLDLAELMPYASTLAVVCFGGGFTDHDGGSVARDG